jgi:hypothetical protein
VVTSEELGGADLRCRTSGVADHLAADDPSSSFSFHTLLIPPQTSCIVLGSNYYNNDSVAYTRLTSNTNFFTRAFAYCPQLTVTLQLSHLHSRQYNP